MAQTQPNTTFLKSSTILSNQDNIIYTALSNETISPKDCDTQNVIIRNHLPSVYEYVYSLISANIPNNFTHPIDFITTPPKQLKLIYPLSNYLHRYKYYLEMIAYLKNDFATIDDSEKLDTLMLGSN